MKIHQTAIVRDLVIDKELFDYNTNVISMTAGLSIKITDPEDYKKVNLRIYQRLVRKLIYLLGGIRPNIVFVVRQLSRYNANPRKDYLQVAKRVVRYPKGTIKIELTFCQKSIEQLPRDLPSYGLIKYADSNFVRDPKD